MTATPQRAQGIAIVGMAGHFPAASDISALWSMLKDGREATTWLSDADLAAAGVPADEASNAAYVKAAMILDDLENFDAEFFGFSPREASILDPQHRHFLECCWESLEDAGHPPSRFSGAVGVFGGCGPQTYFARNLLPNAELVRSVGQFLLRHTGNDKDFLTTRVSYLLNLKGPSVGIQTACSTSLVAVHMACQSLYAGECDMALAGGASVELPHRTGYIAAEGEILSPTGHCAAFDNSAAGTIFGSGAGVVVLRRLEDALADGDNIHAVILGSAVNNDGAGKAGYFAPSVDGQASAAAEAMAIAGIEPSSISYIEAHGTGTVIGDPIELAALQEVYATGAAKGSIGIGSIKSNIGHLDTAAGVASLMKVVLSMKHETLPASLNFSEPNRRFNFAESPFSVVGSARPWPKSSKPRRASVNSLGVGGTNAHVVVEDAPILLAPAQHSDLSRWHLFTLSAKTPTALNALAQKWRAFAATGNQTVDLADTAYTSHVGREVFQHRLAVVARTEDELAAALASPKSPRQSRGSAGQTAPGVVFMFPGGGAQYPGCAGDLYRDNAIFRSAADSCFARVPPDFADLKSIMLGEDSLLPDAGQRLAHPLFSILAIFITEVALAHMWQSFGVQPVAVIANSAGDYAAAVVAGILSLEDAIKIVVWRGEIFAAMPPGAMLSVHMPEDQLRGLAGADLDVAVLGAPDLGVISGDVDAIERVRARLEVDDIEYSRVRIDVAAHSRMLDPFLPGFRERLMSVRFSAPSIPFMSCLTGAWAEPKDISTPDYWVRQARSTVRFSHGLSALLDRPGRVLLEVGPGKSLSPFASLANADHPPHAVIASTRSAMEADDDVAVATLAAGQLWAAGVDVDLAALRGPGERRRVSLPTYAFERKRHWIDAPLAQTYASPGPADRSSVVAESMATIKRLPDVDDWIQLPIWRERSLPAAANISEEAAGATTLVFSDRSPLADALVAALKRRGSKPLVVEIADRPSLDGVAAWSIDPANEDHYTKLIEAFAAQGIEPVALIHLWSLNPLATRNGAGDRSTLTTSFDSLFLLMRALQLADYAHGIRIDCITSGAVAVGRSDVVHPLNATLLGPIRVWSREADGSSAQLIDIVPAAGDEDRIVTQILAEAGAGSSETLVALRGAHRHVLRFECAPRSELETSPSRILNDGVYIITGGVGSLGLLLARHLVLVCGARVALISRRENPIALPSELVKNTIVLSADVTDETAMARAIDETRLHFGRLDGVIHAAGIVDDAPIGAKTLADARRVLAPKVIGGLVLDRLLPAGTISLFAVFSSTSAILGPPGQIDYVAANAFLDALAASRPDGLAIDWGIWGDIGMAARPLIGDHSATTESGAEPGDHPLLGAMLPHSGVDRVFETPLDPSKLWPLSEHIIADVPVLPGTAYLECARAAMARIVLAPRYELTSVAFLAPLRVMRGSKRRLRTQLTAVGPDLWSVEISSLSEGSSQEELHFTCEAAVLQNEIHAKPAIMNGGSLHTGDLIAQSSTLSLGPRWTSIQSVSIDADSVQSTLELDQAYASELDVYSLHPALLDSAMTIGLHLTPKNERAEFLYVPASIGAVQILAPLRRGMVATARMTSREPGKHVEFSVAITAPDDTPLVIISKLDMRAVDRNLFANAIANIVLSSQNPLEALLAAGLRASEASSLFARAFEAGAVRRVVSSIALVDLERLYARRRQPAAKTAQATPKAAPEMTDTEQKIAAMFADLLGIADVRPEDGFLALGGHSLAAVRLFAKIRKQTGVDLGIATLFQAPSVRELARLIDDSSTESHTAIHSTQTTEGSRSVASASAVATRDRPALNGSSSTDWTPLVRISNGQLGNRPLFWVHGAAGNVISINALADQLRKRHTLFGLQAHGVDGRIPPQEKIEDMAASYTAAIREADPIGPYCLLGYSGGGVIAYEMAQQLRASGQRIALLAMIDTLAPTSAGGASFLHWLQYGWRWGPTKLVSQARSGMRLRLDSLANRWFPSKFDGRTVDPILANADRVFAGYLRAQRRYYTLPYAGEILLFRAKNAGVGFYAAGETLGWGKFVENRIEVHEIEANHETIVHKPSIDGIAAILDAKLQSINNAACNDKAALHQN